MSNSPQPKSPAAKSTPETPPTKITPATPTPQPTPAAQGTNPSPSSDQTPAVAFTTDKIGQWKSQQENPFAEQNRKTAAKRAKREATVRKVFPVGLIASLAVLGAALIFCVVMLIVNLTGRQPSSTEDDGEDYSTPVIAGNSDEDIAKYRDALQKFYNRNPNATDSEKAKEVDRVVSETLKTPDGEAYSDAVRLAQMGACIMSGCYAELIDAATAVNVNNLTPVQQAQYYNMLANAYYLTGDYEKAQEYFAINIDTEDYAS